MVFEKHIYNLLKHKYLQVKYLSLIFFSIEISYKKHESKKTSPIHLLLSFAKNVDL